jgi:hypothetical protein
MQLFYIMTIIGPNFFLGNVFASHSGYLLEKMKTIWVHFLCGT